MRSYQISKRQHKLLLVHQFAAQAIGFVLVEVFLIVLVFAVDWPTPTGYVVLVMYTLLALPYFWKVVEMYILRRVRMHAGQVQVSGNTTQRKLAVNNAELQVWSHVSSQVPATLHGEYRVYSVLDAVLSIEPITEDTDS